jgi:hypothetical protein
MQSQLLAGLAANHFNYTFVHYADTDDAGHSSGWGSTAYNNAMRTIDGYLGALFNLVNTDATLAGRTTIVLSADHGGTGNGHNDASSPLVYTIPFYVWGAGVAQSDLYALNSGSRTNPGSSRPTYIAAGQPIRNGDGGNLALDLLGLGPIPGSLINAAQNLNVAALDTPGDFNSDGRVDASDYVLWRSGVGTAYTQADYELWRANFGAATAGSGASSAIAVDAAAVPEPFSAGLLLVAISTGLIRRTRTRYGDYYAGLCDATAE